MIMCNEYGYLIPYVGGLHRHCLLSNSFMYIYIIKYFQIEKKNKNKKNLRSR